MTETGTLVDTLLHLVYQPAYFTVLFAQRGWQPVRRELLEFMCGLGPGGSIDVTGEEWKCLAPYHADPACFRKMKDEPPDAPEPDTVGPTSEAEAHLQRGADSDEEFKAANTEELQPPSHTLSKLWM